MRSLDTTHAPEAEPEQRLVARGRTAEDLFGAWDDDPEGAWPELRRSIEERWPELDRQDLRRTRGRPARVLALIGRHTGLDHSRVTALLERVLRDQRDRRARR